MLSIFSQFIFGNSSLFGKQHSDSKFSTWKDKSLCFDLSQSDLELNNGEQLIACFFPIEDIKGNQDEFGILSATNLRLIWICCNKRRVNLSIGWRTVCLAFEQNLKDSLGSPVTSLCVLTKYESTKYEFVFNKMSAFNELWNSQDNWNALVQLRRFMKKDKSLLITHLTPMYLNEPFEVVFKVWQCYKQTCLFRFCRANLTQLTQVNETNPMQASKVDDIIKLPSEEIIDTYQDIVRCESRAIKYIGVLILTNIRLIWVDETLQMRNLSMPYIRIESIKFKHNEKILLNTCDYLATSNQIELRVQKSGVSQQKKAKLLFEQIQNLYSLYKTKPRFGPESCDDCINFMAQLRPIENYFEPMDGAKLGENLGPPVNHQAFMADIESVEMTNERNQVDLTEAEVKVEANENDLTRYSKNLNSYLDEKPIERDMDLIYSPGLSLTTAKIFKEQVNYDEFERNEGKLYYLNLNLSALVGLLMIFYAIFGIFLNWLNRINVKLLNVWIINISMSLFGFLITYSSSTQVVPMMTNDIKMDSQTGC